MPVPDPGSPGWMPPRRAASSIEAMYATGYRILGFVVWRVSRWYVRKTFHHVAPSRRTVLLVGAAGTVLAGALLLANRREPV